MSAMYLIRSARLTRCMRPIQRRLLSASNEAAAVSAPAPGATGVSSAKVAALVDQVVSLNMLEVRELTDALKDRLGVDDSALAPMAMAAPAAAAPAPVEEKVEKTEFDVKLTGFDSGKKIAIIKEVRAITGLGLKEAKAAVEGAPKVIKAGISKNEAEELQRKLKDLGAEVELE